MTGVHLIACVAAIIVGAMVLVRPKGTAIHRALGFAYVVATFTYCGSSFFMYPSTGRLTPFHLISIQNLMLVSCGVSLPRFLRHRIPRWYAWHLRLMAYSYIALVVTGFRFVLPYFPQNRVIPILVFVALPLGSWFWIERIGHYGMVRIAFRTPQIYSVRVECRHDAVTEAVSFRVAAMNSHATRHKVAGITTVRGLGSGPCITNRQTPMESDRRAHACSRCRLGIWPAPRRDSSAVHRPLQRSAGRAAHHVSFWDAMNLTACLDAGISLFYSEDVPVGAIGGVVVVNPFE
jgi:uncharacterized membrane protein